MGDSPISWGQDIQGIAIKRKRRWGALIVLSLLLAFMLGSVILANAEADEKIPIWFYFYEVVIIAGPWLLYAYFSPMDVIYEPGVIRLKKLFFPAKQISGSHFEFECYHKLVPGRLEHEEIGIQVAVDSNQAIILIRMKGYTTDPEYQDLKELAAALDLQANPAENPFPQT